MALFQPSNITPDVRSGLGFGTIDARKTWKVSWRVNGANAMTAFRVSVYRNTTAGQLVYTTGRRTDGCPFYGTTPTGEAQMFSYTMPAISALSNGGTYKLVITQWWSASDSITQNSASVFLTRATPTLTISPIGENSVVSDREYTFLGNYAQSDGDVLNWFRWEIAAADDLGSVLYDTENVSGTMNIQCFYDGLFTGQRYAVRLTAQTQSGVACDTGWKVFSVDYGEPIPSDNISAACAKDTNAVLVSWRGGEGDLETPEQTGALTYDGTEQTPTFSNYDPDKMTMGGVTAATDAGTYTATFTPNPGYSWDAQYPDATAWAIYRRGADGRFVHLADVPAARGELYDYSAASRQGPYTYYAFPIGENGVLGAPLESNSVRPCFQSWSLMECQKNGDGYTVVREYLFRYNFSSGDISNNNRPSIEKNFSRYPTVFRAPQNYRSGSLSYLIGTVDYENGAKYSDTLAMRQRLFDLSTTQNALFLKSRKGDLIYVAISEAVSVKISDNTFEQAQSVSLQWVEIGPSGNLLKLTALENAAGGDGLLSPNLVLDPDSVAISVGETVTVNATWEGNGTLSADTGGSASVVITNDVLAVTKNQPGQVTIPVSVSPTAQYTGQTVALSVEAVGIAVAIPTLASGAMTYNGDVQTPRFNHYDPTAMDKSGDSSARNAGDYQTVFSLKSGYVWEDGTLGDQIIPWSIGKASCELSVTPTSLTVSAGDTGTFTISKVGDGAVTVTSSDTSVATVEFVDTSTATVVPTPSQSNTLRYTGSSQSPTWSGYNSAIMTLSGTTSGVEPNDYPAVFTLASGYVWDDTPRGLSGAVYGVAEGSAVITVTVAETQNYFGDTATVGVTVESAQQIPIPSQSGSLTWNGSSQSPTWSNYDSSKMTIGGTQSATNAGEYEATFALNSGYQWSDGTSGQKTVTWSIEKYTPTLTVSPTSAAVSVGGTKTFTISYDGDATSDDFGANGDGYTYNSSTDTFVGDYTNVAIRGNTITVTGKTQSQSVIFWISADETDNCNRVYSNNVSVAVS